MSDDQCDMMIIGAGISGITAAWKLSSTNYKIIVLEQNNFYKKKDYAKKNKDWGLNKINFT